MGGGLMQLVAYGAQDVYPTGNPQISKVTTDVTRTSRWSLLSKLSTDRLISVAVSHARSHVTVILLTEHTYR